MFGAEPTERGDESLTVRIGAKGFGHGRDGVRHVVVAWTAAKGEAAGERRDVTGIEGVEAERVAGALHHGGKATVEIEVRNVVTIYSEVAQRAPQRAHGGRVVELWPIRDQPVIVGVGAADGKDHAVARDAE